MNKFQAIVFETICAQGERWISRKQLAEILGRPGRINPADIRALNVLLEEGLIEQRASVQGVAREFFEYRAKPGAARVGELIENATRRA